MMVPTLIGCSMAAGLGAAAYLGPQLPRRRAVALDRARCARARAVCLTFDDGPGPVLTRRVLEILRGARCVATFYLLGRRAQMSPDAADETAAAGHEMAAHTMWHRHAWRTSPWSAHADVEAGYRALSRWVGESGRFRPPYGKLNVGSWRAARRRGAPIDWWTIDSGDTGAELPDPSRTADVVARQNGGVVLLHDFDREVDADARAAYVLSTVEAIIRRAETEGLRFLTMSQLSREAATA